MKKYLSLLLGISMVLCLPACSSQNSESSKKDTNEIDYTTLDSSWECDYLKLSTNSNWEVDDDIKDSSISVFFKCSIDDSTYSHIQLYLSFSNAWEKKGESESIDQWNRLKSLTLQDGDEWEKEQYQNKDISDSFVKNGQAYIVITDSGAEYEEIQFYANKLHGTLFFSSEQVSTVLEVIDSIEFYT